MITFLVGGLTFLPILAALLIGIIFYTSPITKTDRLSNKSRESTEIEDGIIYRAGWISVRRTYEEPESGGSYVEMITNGYKSFIDNRVRESRKTKAKDLFYAVLKNSSLYLFENEAQVDCVKKIDLSQFKIDIFPRNLIDGELFVKRTGICLELVENGVRAEESYVAIEDLSYNLELNDLPWFLFMKVNSDKEDWFHSIVKAKKSTESINVLAKDAKIFEKDDLERLLIKMDNSLDSIPTRWLNALLGRIFLGIAKTQNLENYIIERIVKKLKRVKTPSILSEILVKEVDVGSALPIFTKPILKSLNSEGELMMEVALNYSGSFKITIETVATISLGSRFKPYAVRIVLAIILKELEGNLLFKIKPNPSNRIWFGFTTMPKVVMVVEPVVSERKINWSIITSILESRIREVILESIVVPNMDDLPFFNSSHFEYRGGIFGDALRKEELPTLDVSTEEEVLEEIAGPIQDISNEKLKEDDLNLRRRKPLERTNSEQSVTEGKSGSPTPSLAGFSLSSWSRENKLKEKKSSWFPARANSSTSSPMPSTPPIKNEETDSSATRLRDSLQKRAKERESNQLVTNELQEEIVVPSGLSLTAPKSLSLQESPSFDATILEDSLHVPIEPITPLATLENSIASTSKGRSNSLSKASPPTTSPLRKTHSSTVSMDSSGSNLLTSLRNKDKQAVLAGVNSAKDSLLRRWRGTEVMEPTNELAQTSSTSSQSLSGVATGEEAGKEEETENSKPIAISDSQAETASITSTKGKRKISISTHSISPKGKFLLGPVEPITKLSNVEFSNLLPVTPTASKSYQGSKMMVIPGIRDQSLKQKVAEDHLSAIPVVEDSPVKEKAGIFSTARLGIGNGTLGKSGEGSSVSGRGESMEVRREEEVE